MGKYYTPKEAAKLLRINESTVYRHLNAGRLRGCRAGNLWRISETQLKEFLETGGIMPKEKRKE